MDINSLIKPEIQTKYNILNLGAGVQSSCLALMAEHGEVAPRLDAAIFADTQAEPESVYRWLDWLEQNVSFPVIRVTHGDLTQQSLAPKLRVKNKTKNQEDEFYMRRLIPLFGIMPDGEKTAAIGRKCTADFKIKPIIKKIKEIAEIKRGQKEVTVTQWIGISWDEVQRMKESNCKWSQHRWPLIEKRMRRGDCLAWMAEHGYPEPPRSACYYCPFHSNQEWRRLRDDEPEFFSKAVKFDKDIRKAYADHDPTMKMTVYLHNSCKPLSIIDFDNDEDKGQQVWDFMSECEGMCGV